MEYSKLAIQTNKTINYLTKFMKNNRDDASLESIINQMIFIRDNAQKNINPTFALSDGRKFTYAILASRELSSPDELKLKEEIDKVSKLLDEE